MMGSSGTREPIRVFLIEDHALLRDGVRSALAPYPDIAVVGEADRGRTAIEEVPLSCADVVLLKCHLPDINGLEVLRCLTTQRRAPRVIFLTSLDETWRVRQALREGATGYLSKRGVSAHRLAEAIRDAHEGNVALSPDVTSNLLRLGGDRPEMPGEKLTSREREVWLLLSIGATNADISDRLFISVRTVKFHVSNILSKTGTRNRAEAGALAHRAGRLDVDHGASCFTMPAASPAMHDGENPEGGWVAPLWV